jgi:hypothetical protein
MKGIHYYRNFDSVLIAGPVITMSVIAKYRQIWSECESCSGAMFIQGCIRNIHLGRKIIELKRQRNNRVIICGTLPESALGTQKKETPK